MKYRCVKHKQYMAKRQPTGACGACMDLWYIAMRLKRKEIEEVSDAKASPRSCHDKV